jgi:membrane protease subunit HflK
MRLRNVLLILLALYLLTGVVQVRPEERAVVRRFGRVVARPGPGLWVGLPWGIDRVDRVPVRTVRQLPVGYNPDAGDDTAATPAGQLLTGDQNLVNVQLVVEYAVDETDAGLDDFVMHRDRAEAVLAREAEALAGDWVGGRSVDEVLLTGNAALPAWVTGRLQARLDPHRLGVVVQRASVKHLAAPEEVRAAFTAVNEAQTAIRTRENEALQQAQQRTRQAEAFRYRQEQEAAAYREEKSRLAKADAESFLKRLDQYRQLKATNPAVLSAIWWDETGRLLLALKARGRIDVLDAYLGKDGLDITQFLAPKKR